MAEKSAFDSRHDSDFSFLQITQPISAAHPTSCSAAAFFFLGKGGRGLDLTSWIVSSFRSIPPLNACLHDVVPIAKHRDVSPSLSDTKHPTLSKERIQWETREAKRLPTYIPAQLLHAKRTWQSVTQLCPVSMQAWSSGCQVDRWGWQTFAVVSCRVLFYCL